MKAMTWTAIVAFLFAIPFVLKKRIQPVQAAGRDNTPSLKDENIRYSIDDFLI